MTDEALRSDEPAASSTPSGTPRSYLVTLALLAVGAGALFLGYGRTWSTTRLTESGLPALLVELSGRDVQPAGAATAIVGLAAIAGLVATRRVGRILSGLVLIIVGVLDTILAVRFGLGERASVVAAVSERAGRDVDPELVRAATTTSIWWLAAAFGGACFVVAGVITLLKSSTWPHLGSRYERNEQSSGRAPRAVSAWDQLDEGVDPTLDAPTLTSPTAVARSEAPAGPDDVTNGATGTL